MFWGKFKTYPFHSDTILCKYSNLNLKYISVKITKNMKSKSLYRNYIGICISLIFIVIMFILRVWTNIDSSFYILFFFPSIIIFPYSNKVFISRIIYIVMCMLLSFIIWSHYGVQDLIVSFCGGFFAFVGTSILNFIKKNSFK